ncbi:hypothetical protein OG216_14685 [Streptomycetaceae bacterium NBC_01309]
MKVARIGANAGSGFAVVGIVVVGAVAAGAVWATSTPRAEERKEPVGPPVSTRFVHPGDVDLYWTPERMRQAEGG